MLTRKLNHYLRFSDRMHAISLLIDTERDISFQRATCCITKSRNLNQREDILKNKSPLIQFIRSMSSTTSCDLPQFKLISPHDKKIISKNLGFKISFLNETDLQISPDLEGIVVNFYSLDKHFLLRSYPQHYSVINNGCHRLLKKAQHNNNLPEFLFYILSKNDSNDIQNIDHFLNKIVEEQEKRNLVIFDNLFDALSFYQQLKIPTIVLELESHKESSENFKLFCRKLNDNFDQIYLWPKRNAKFEEIKKKFCKNVDLNKLYLTESQCLSPMEFLNKNSKEKFDTLINNATPIHHPFILKFQDLKNDVFKEFTDPAICGVQWSRFTKLNEYLKGFRDGELTIVTGPTGCGKTTFVSEYSIDLCSQGVPTLWGSFEIKNVRLIKTMMTQFLRKTLSFTNLNEFNEESKEFGQLPLYFMKFHGQTDIDMFMKAAKHSVKAFGIKHIVIDNLQFMLGLNVESNYDRFLKQDLLISSLRQFSTENECHITLVAHPRKEKEDISLSNNSLYGGIKASQEADNVLIIMNKFNTRYRCNKYVQITKNRYNGNLGILPLYFDKSTLCFSSKPATIPSEQQGIPSTISKMYDSHPDGNKDDVVSQVYKMRYLLEN